MTQKEWHTVNGTLFGFPALPPEDNEVTRNLRSAYDYTLDKARKVKPVKTRFSPPRGPRPPKPGNGVFEPKTGERGSTVPVVIRVVRRYDRGGYKEFETVFTDEREGMVVDLAPRSAGGLWVSLWDGKTPVGTGIDRDGYARIRMSVDEYRERFGEDLTDSNAA